MTAKNRNILVIVIVVVALIILFFPTQSITPTSTPTGETEYYGKINNQPPQEHPLGSMENPIHIERIVIDYSGLISLQPSDSVWFSIDPRHLGQYGFQTKFSSLGGKFNLWRIGDKKCLTETPNKRIPNREMVGVTKFCLHNTGDGTVILYAWYGHKSTQDIQALAGL